MRSIHAHEVHTWSDERKAAWLLWLHYEEQDPNDIFQVDLNDDGTANYHRFIKNEQGYRIRDTPETVATIIVYNIPIHNECPEGQ